MDVVGAARGDNGDSPKWRAMERSRLSPRITPARLAASDVTKLRSESCELFVQRIFRYSEFRKRLIGDEMRLGHLQVPSRFHFSLPRD